MISVRSFGSKQLRKNFPLPGCVLLEACDEFNENHYELGYNYISDADPVDVAALELTEK